MIEVSTRRTKSAPRARALACASLLAASGAAGIAHAAEPARASGPAHALVICAQCVTDADSAIESDVREALLAQKRFEVLPPSNVDLEAAQLSVDCREQSAECLKKVASKLHAGVLVVTSLSRKKSTTTLELLYFDAASSEAPRSVTRSQKAGKASKPWRDELPALLTELIGKSEPIAAAQSAEPVQAEPTADAVATPQAQEEAAGASRDAEPENALAGSGHRLPLAPLLIGSGGVALVVSGLVVGAIMRGTESDYASREITTTMDAERAEDQRISGRQQAVIANVLLGTGFCAVAVAGVWLALELRQPEQPPKAARTTLAPLLGPRVAGLSLSGTWERRP